MARDGQGARDYGTHLLPETDWKLYGPCFRCKVEAGVPCLDMRHKHAVPKRNWVPHVRRPLISVLDGAGVLKKMES